MSQNALARSAWFPPANAEVVQRGGLFPLGVYRTPDGQEVTALAFPQPMRDALDALGYAGGMSQDPAAPQGYVSQNALIRGGQGLAESAAVGSLAARAPAGALRSGAARGADELDPSQAARMARAREMGFDTDVVYYHGTNADFDEFKPGMYDSVFLTPDRNIAESHADKSIFSLFKPSGRVVEAYVKGRSIDHDGLARMVESGDAPDMTKAEAIAWLRENGYDSFFNTPRNELIVFDPRNIRSVNALFDPIMSDSANILASNPMAGAVPITLDDPERRKTK